MWLLGRGGVVWKKCRCLDLIDASYKLFPAIFFFILRRFFFFFYSRAGEEKTGGEALGKHGGRKKRGEE